MGEGRSLAETPTWSVATVTTAMVAVCFLVERSIYHLGQWLKKTKRKAMLASLEKIREELMLLGLISLMLSQTARWISKICVPSSLFSSRFYICSEGDFSMDDIFGGGDLSPLNRTTLVNEMLGTPTHQCGQDLEPFVSFQGLEQLHRFLFILGITHVLYSFVTVVLSMIKIYSWRKWEDQACLVADENLQAKRVKTMKRQSTFVFHHASHPWSKSKILIWMLCFMHQFKGSIAKSDYMALRLGFITDVQRMNNLVFCLNMVIMLWSALGQKAQDMTTQPLNHKLPHSYNFHKYMVRSMEDEFRESIGISWALWIYAILCIFINIHGLNIYLWLSFVPAILVMLVGTKLQHVVAQLALEIVEATGPHVGTQLKPRDELFWFGKPEILLWLIQFISFQNAFEMATFIWSLWEFNAHSCFMKNHLMVVVRLLCGLLVQVWCSYSTLPLNVIITQMGSKFRKSLIAESVRESLHSWCRRVKGRSKRDSLPSRLGTTRSTCSLESTIDENDDTNTIGSGTLSPRSPCRASLEELPAPMDEQTMFKLSRL